MFFPGRFTPKLLVWLTVLAMPFQSAWGATCACSTIVQPGAVKASMPTSPCCGGHSVAPKQTCCRKLDVAQSACCGRAVDLDRKVACHCGAGCRCYQRDEKPSQPPAPAPENDRNPTVVELAVSQVAATCIPVGDRGNFFTAEFDSAFCLPGAQVCVLLCRFTL